MAHRPSLRTLGSMHWSGWAPDAPDATKYLEEIRAKLGSASGPSPRAPRARSIDLGLRRNDSDAVARLERQRQEALEQARGLELVAGLWVDPGSGEIADAEAAHDPEVNS